MYSHNNTSENRVFNNMRNNFVSQVPNNNSYDNLSTRKYSISDEDDSFNFHNTSSSGLTGTGQKNRNKKSKQRSPFLQAQDIPYELEPLPLHNNPPFENHEYRSPYSNIGGNPFVDPNRENDITNANRIHSNPFDDNANTGFEFPQDYNRSHPPLLDEEGKIRANEKARIRQLKRNSKYHYSKLPYVTAVLTLIQVIVFIVELVKMAQLTGSAFQTKPYFNPMLGPSTYVLINMGARYVPCMQPIKDVTDDISISFPCPNSTTTQSNVCPLSELCGMSGIKVSDNKYEPDQWYRVITPMFLHAGFLHIIFNLLLQITMGPVIEQNIGSLKYFIIYFASGIMGFLLGANFAPNGIASSGASGALFGIVATNIVMFIYSGKKNTNIYGTKKYALFLCIMVGEIVVSFVLGLLPGLDNFSHIGGFAMGLLLDIVLLPDPFFVYVDGIITYNADDNALKQVANKWNPMYHMDDKITHIFYIWCGVRVVCLVLAIIFFALLIKNFFNSKEKTNDNSCKWCKYINCIPIHGWCDLGEVNVESVSSGSGNSNKARRNTPSTSSTDRSNAENIERAKWDVFYTTINEDYTLTPAPTQAISHSTAQPEYNNVALGIPFLIFFITFFFMKKKGHLD